MPPSWPSLAWSIRALAPTGQVRALPRSPSFSSAQSPVQPTGPQASVIVIVYGGKRSCQCLPETPVTCLAQPFDSHCVTYARN